MNGSIIYMQSCNVPFGFETYRRPGKSRVNIKSEYRLIYQLLHILVVYSFSFNAKCANRLRVAGYHGGTHLEVHSKCGTGNVLIYSRY